MRNAISLRHTRTLIVAPGHAAAPLPQLATLLKNIESLGFTFAPPLLERVGTLPPERLAALYDALVPALKSLVGADVRFAPLYPGFPAQVMAMHDAELYINAIIHYLTHWRPEYPADVRQPLLERTDLTPIDLGDEEDFRQIARRLIGAKIAISPADKADLAWFVGEYRHDIEALLPREIPSKENLAYLAGLLLEHAPAAAQTALFRYVKTATDVLRLAVARSGGDVSLAAPTRFRSFKRAERRLLLSLLESCGGITEDMLRRPGPWVRLGERLHPFEMRQAYPKSAAAFDIVRNKRPFATFDSAVEQALARGDCGAAVALLRRRPGVFARRLDQLLRHPHAGDRQAFRELAPDVATPVLLQAMAHFTHRNQPRELRVFFPKGDVGKAYALAGRLPPLDQPSAQAAVAICRAALIARFRRLPPLGRTYVDEDLRRYLVPFSQRSASKALRTIVRGSRLPLPAGSTLRFFLWWKEGAVNGKPTGRVDIDLSSVLYGAEWEYREHIAYTNLKSATYRAAHSGDIVSAPEGACEFIDIDIDSVLRYGGRYVVMSLNSFTSQPYCDLPECYAGWMMRQEPQSGEIFEPRTVRDKIDLAANTTICVPVIIDLAERALIWTDLALRRNVRWQNNVEGNQHGMRLMGKALTTLAKPTLYDLFELHALARGAPAPREAAESLFAPDAGVTPFDIDRIMAEYL